MRLLGLVFDERLTFWALVNDITSRARNKIWGLLRLREAGAPIDILKINYCTRVRNTLEYGSPVWGGLLSGIQEKEIEDIQLLALQVIMGSQSSSYTTNLKRLELSRLKERRQRLTLNFAISAYRSHKHRSWFKPTPPPPKCTRDKSPRFIVPSYHTSRSDGIPLSVFARVLNEISDEEWSRLDLPPPNSCTSKPNLQLSELCLSTRNTNESPTHVSQTSVVPAPVSSVRSNSALKGSDRLDTYNPPPSFSSETEINQLFDFINPL